MSSTVPSLTLGGKIVAVAGALFVVATFLPWYTFSFTGLGMSRSDSADAWDVTLPRLASLLVLVALAELILVQVVKVKLPGGVAALWPLGRLAGSGLAALLVLIELVKGQDVELPDTAGLASISGGLVDSSDLAIDASFGRGFGLFLGLALAIALVLGNVLRLSETPETAGPSMSGGRPRDEQTPPYGTPDPYGPRPTQPGQGQPQQYPPQQGDGSY